MGKKSKETFFCAQILKFFDANPGSEKEKMRIRDGKYSDPGSGINIPDPQYWSVHYTTTVRSVKVFENIHSWKTRILLQYTVRLLYNSNQGNSSDFTSS
jgi:hypothetical protein